MDPVEPENQPEPNADAEQNDSKPEPPQGDDKSEALNELPKSEPNLTEPQNVAPAPTLDWWDRYKRYAEIAGVVLLAVYTAFTADMYFANKESADAAKSAADTAAASVRPWLKIDSIELRPGLGPIKTLMFHWPITGAPVAPTLQVKVSVGNVGHSVAEDINVVPELFFGPFVSNTWHDVVTAEEKRACRAAEGQAPSGGNGAIVFPSERWSWNGGIGALTPTQDSAAAVILCINYGGTPGTHYQTQAWSGLYESRNDLIRTGVDANANVLRLIRDPSGDHAN